MNASQLLSQSIDCPHSGQARWIITSLCCFSVVFNTSAFNVFVGFNEFITSKLLGGALDALERHGAKSEDITVVWVPGSFELPQTTQKLAASGKYNAVISLGAVIRGATPHFDYIAAEAAKGIAQVSMQSEMPISFGVLTCDTIEQAIEQGVDAFDYLMIGTRLIRFGHGALLLRCSSSLRGPLRAIRSGFAPDPTNWGRRSRTGPAAGRHGVG